MLLKSGVYIKFELHIFCPPPFLIYIFAPTEIYYNEGVCAAGDQFSTFFCNFVYFKSIGEKICLLFTNWGKNMHFPPFFYPLSIMYFPQPVIQPYFCPKQKNIHPWLNMIKNHILKLMLFCSYIFFSPYKLILMYTKCTL